MQTIAAQSRLLFNDHGLGTQLGGTRCNGEAGRTTSDDTDIIIILIGHRPLLWLSFRDQLDLKKFTVHAGNLFFPHRL
jgi:hypothetical protein